MARKAEQEQPENISTNIRPEEIDNPDDFVPDFTSGEETPGFTGVSSGIVEIETDIVEDIHEQVLIPEGEVVKVLISVATVGPNKAGKGQNLSLQLDITEGEYEGMSIFHNVSLPSKAQKALSAAKGKLGKQATSEAVLALSDEYIQRQAKDIPNSKGWVYINSLYTVFLAAVGQERNSLNTDILIGKRLLASIGVDSYQGKSKNTIETLSAVV